MLRPEGLQTLQSARPWLEASKFLVAAGTLQPRSEADASASAEFGMHPPPIPWLTQMKSFFH